MLYMEMLGPYLISLPPPPKHARTQADEGFDIIEQVRGVVPGPFRHQREHHLFHSWLTK